MAKAPLVAVRRAENVGDPQPHPCFCVTSVGTWRRLPGDWSGGYTWPGHRGKLVTDVGGNLLRALELAQLEWVQILRSNRVNLDPLFFGLYGDVIYHHGAGFRPGELSRAYLDEAPPPLKGGDSPLLGPVVKRLNVRRRSAWERGVQRTYLERSEAIYEKISAGGDEWLDELK